MRRACESAVSADPNDITAAALFRAALLMRIATPAHLVAWADREVMARPLPPEWILDLSVSGNWPLTRVVDLLRGVADGSDPADVFDLLVGLIVPDESWNYEQAVRADNYMFDSALTVDAVTIADEIAFHDDGLMGKHYVGQFDAPAFVAGVVAFARKHSNPAARAWLPGVQVTFDG